MAFDIEQLIWKFYFSRHVLTDLLSHFSYETVSGCINSSSCRLHLPGWSHLSFMRLYTGGVWLSGNGHWIDSISIDIKNTTFRSDDFLAMLMQDWKLVQTRGHREFRVIPLEFFEHAAAVPVHVTSWHHVTLSINQFPDGTTVSRLYDSKGNRSQAYLLDEAWWCGTEFECSMLTPIAGIIRWLDYNP